MRTFLDANVLLELLLERTRYTQTVEAIQAKRTYCVSPLSIHLAYHYCAKDKVDLKKLKPFLDSYEILPMDDLVIKLAQQRIPGRDFEDCLQAACAELGDCDEILTLDKSFKKSSGTKLPVRVV